jgi:hypothetical protein
MSAWFGAIGRGKHMFIVWISYVVTFCNCSFWKMIRELQSKWWAFGLRWNSWVEDFNICILKLARSTELSRNTPFRSSLPYLHFSFHKFSLTPIYVSIYVCYGLRSMYMMSISINSKACLWIYIYIYFKDLEFGIY